MARYQVPPAAFEQAAQLAEFVLSDVRTTPEAEKALIKLNPKMSTRTAKGYIGCYLAMKRGTRGFGTTVSSRAWRFMLERISSDGPAALATALEAFASHIVYLQSVTNGPETALQTVRDEFAERLKSHVMFDIASFELDSAVQASLNSSASEREARLKCAAKTPEQALVFTRVFRRNPDVIAEVLSRAGGNCEQCREPAPFSRPDGRPYLEVHHKKRLADGGEDSVENAMAVCPNCHREQHYGAAYAQSET